jgi:hypothetical protein
MATESSPPLNPGRLLARRLERGTSVSFGDEERVELIAALSRTAASRRASIAAIGTDSRVAD